MKNKELARKVKELRNRKGYSQEELADKTGLSLRTIQRIENGETEPRGDSLKRLATVFEVSPNEIIDWVVQEDQGYLISLNLSALCFIVMPVLGVLIPLIIWIARKDKVKDLNGIAKDLLNFQISWLLALLVGYIVHTFSLVFKLHQASLAKGLSSSFSCFLVFLILMYAYNIVLIIINSIRLKKGKTPWYYPKIRFIRK